MSSLASFVSLPLIPRTGQRGSESGSWIQLVSGRGLGTEAIRLALAYGFEHLDLHRVSLTVLADNTHAIAAYIRCGFSVEGLLRQTLLRDGARHDDLSMAILKPQWEAHEAGT